jgi:hypothetical protein
VEPADESPTRPIFPKSVQEGLPDQRPSLRLNVFENGRENRDTKRKTVGGTSRRDCQARRVATGQDTNLVLLEMLRQFATATKLLDRPEERQNTQAKSQKDGKL